MESDSRRAHNKKTLLSIGTLMLSLAALQGPLWRSQQSLPSVAVRSGGATLIALDRPIADIAMDAAGQATAEVVGDREVLVRGKTLGESRLVISMKDGHRNIYRVIVQSESAQSGWSSLTSR